jgi:nucleoside-diphosphate-sugar epimerase
MAAAAGVRSGEIFNVAAPRPATWNEMGETAARILGRKFLRVHVPAWAIFAVSAASTGVGRVRGEPAALNLSKFNDMRPDYWEADVRKARELLGFEARTSLEEGLRETIDWYVRNGLL